MLYFGSDELLTRESAMNLCLRQLLRTASISLIAAAAIMAPLAGKAAAVLWTGPSTNFTLSAGANPNLAANQDRLTSNIWITRGPSQGLFNANSEASFSHFFSPAGTEWATGFLTNYASLTYTDWNSWAKGVNAGPPSTVGVNAVLHLIPDNIYLSVRFTSWASGGVGGFSWTRSTPVVPEPSPTALLLFGFLAMTTPRLQRLLLRRPVSR